MIAESGHYALVLALALALVQMTVPFVGARKNDPVLMAVAGPTAVAQWCFVALAFGALLAGDLAERLPRKESDSGKENDTD